MAKKSKTIEEVKKAKIDIEKQVLKIIQDFEKENGVRLSYISIDRERDDREELKPLSEQGPVKNIDINMELDLIY